LNHKASTIYRVEPQGINSDGKYQYDLYVENGSGAAATAHGLAFTISSDVIPISAVAMSATGSSLHPDEAFAITDGNRCHVALTRTDNLDVICDGPIATFVVEASDIPIGIPFEIDVAFGAKIKADATLDNITGATAFGMYNGFAPNTNSIFLDASVTHEQCNGLGEALIIPSGGIEPYTYLWSNGANNNQVSNLTSGIYTVSMDKLLSTMPTATCSAVISVPNILLQAVSRATDYTAQAMRSTLMPPFPQVIPHSIKPDKSSN